MSSNIWSKVKGIIGAVAPTVASIIGTPIAGVAVKGLCEMLGLKDNSSPSEIEKALQQANPDIWLKIKQLESDTKIKLKELGLDEEKIHQMDRDSARQREIKLAESGKRDYTPPVIAAIVFIGFFSLVSLIVFKPPETHIKDLLEIILGCLTGAILTIVNYYFGSSKDSRNKTNILANKLLPQ